jgi:primosomal protein N' (replication factor Y) (superfamily II helicase)
VPPPEPDASDAADPGRDEHARPIAKVVLDAAPLHLDGPLDYLIPDGLTCGVGQRVEVTLRGRRSKGLVVGVAGSSDVPLAKLRPIARTLGEHTWVRPDELELLRWAAARFGAPLGDVVRAALPSRVIDVERIATKDGWFPARTSTSLGPDDPSSSIETAETVAGEAGEAGEVDEADEEHHDDVGWQPYGRTGAALCAAVRGGAGSFLWRPLPGEDIAARLVELARGCLAGGRDVLLIVPDPGSPTADAVLGSLASLDVEAVDVRGGPSDRSSYRAWLRCRVGAVRVAVGERGAAFLPMARLGLAIVLDEASPVHKERRSPRHHVREVLLERARRAGGVGLAVGTVPSAVAWSLVADGRLTPVVGDRVSEEARRPRVRLETGRTEARARISRAGIALLRQALERGGYGVVLAARRGEGRSLVCTRCGDVVRCTACGASVARRSDGGWWCHACGTTSPRPPTCRRCGPGELAPLAAGAERLAAELARTLEGRVEVLEGYAAAVPAPPAVLVMTRGSVLDRPPQGAPVHGVVLPDLDGALRRPVLDAAEDALRLAFAVAGWTVAGREPGASDGDGPDVVVETRDGDHHALRALVAWDPELFWEAESALRQAVRLPPAVALLRLEVHGPAVDLRRLVAPALPRGDQLVGPLPLSASASAFLVKCDDRRATLDALREVREELSRRGADVRLDVDPIDIG